MFALPLNAAPLGDVRGAKNSERLKAEVTPSEVRNRSPSSGLTSANTLPTALKEFCRLLSSSAIASGLEAGQVTGELKSQVPSGFRGLTTGLNQRALITAPLVRPLSVFWRFWSTLLTVRLVPTCRSFE